MKILLLRFSSIGDIILTSPVIRCLKLQTGAEVHYLTKKAFAPILTPNPYVDRVFSFEKKLSEVLPALRSEKYDWIFDLHGNLRSARVKWALGRPSRTFSKLNFEKWLLVQFGINRLPQVHIVDRYLETVKPLGVKYDGNGLDYFIPENEMVHPAEFSEQLGTQPYVVFNLGANHSTKRLPLDKMVEICNLLKGPVLLLGGKAEVALGEHLSAACGPHIVNCCGKLSLHQSASLVKQAAKVLTHDSGFMHIAAAFQKKIVSVWGNTIPEFGMYPKYKDGVNQNTSIEVSGLNCRPCSKIGFAQCPKGHFKCMREQNISAILAALK